MIKNRKISANYLQKIPLRNKDLVWNINENGFVVLSIENKGFFCSIAQKFFKKPKVSYIRFDEYGTTVWKNIDGKTSVDDIVKIMLHTFPKEKDRMLNRVVTFIAILQNNEYIYMKNY